MARPRPRTYSMNSKVCVDVMQTIDLWYIPSFLKIVRTSGSLSVVLADPDCHSDLSLWRDVMSETSCWHTRRLIKTHHLRCYISSGWKRTDTYKEHHCTHELD